MNLDAVLKLMLVVKVELVVVVVVEFVVFTTRRATKAEIGDMLHIRVVSLGLYFSIFS